MLLQHERYCINVYLVYSLGLSLLFIVSPHLSAVMRSDAIFVLTVKTAVSLGKRMYQPYLEIYASLEFTNNVKGCH